jgi:hypothetical protein
MQAFDFPIWKIFAGPAVALLVSYFMTPPVKRFAENVGAIDVPKDARRIHDHPIPRMGGLAIFTGFVLSVLLFVNMSMQVMGLLLGAVMGVCDLIPYMGPYLGAVPIVLFSLSKGLSTALWAAAVTALVQQIEKFLLELGRGFMVVGTQQRVTINNTHYYVDMVFYTKILRAYVLIELKTTKLTPEAAGQINMYLNYYASEVNDPDDNPPIGIILCTEKDSITAEYALGGLSNNVFASRYVLYMPNKEQLIAQVEAVLKKRNRNENSSTGI